MGRTQRIRQKRQKLAKSSPSVHHDLLKFLSTFGWKNPNYLTVTNFPGTGRGLRAKVNLSEHELLIELPLESMISNVTIQNDAEFVELFNAGELESAKSSVNFQSLLALYLLHQKNKSEASRWAPYIKTLPESFSVPYFCQKLELYSLPETLLEKVVEQNNTIKKNFEELTRILNPEVRATFSLNDFKWAFFVCNSRSVFINGKSLEPLVDELNFKELLSDSPNMALAPLLDLLNHSDQAMTKSQLTLSEGFIAKYHEKIKARQLHLSYQLFTLKPVRKHDQIFINYGTYNNTKLLLEYGFIIPDNQFDFLEFSLSDVNNYIKRHPELRTLQIPKHKYKFIRDHDLDQQMYIDINDGLNHNFQAVIAILLVPQNIYNLTQVAFGDELHFCDIKIHAMEIMKQKKIDLEKMCEDLGRRSELSGSGGACCEYFKESAKLIGRVLEITENL